MFNSADVRTVYSIRMLQEAAVSQRPLVFWIGAGASRWAGYESWHDLARIVMFRFGKIEERFDKWQAKDLIKRESYPEFFEICKQQNSSLYYKTLGNALAPKPLSITYQRLVSKLQQLAPLRLLTTNVDESLERNLPQAALIQHSDIDRVASELQSDSSFIIKLHGSISAVKTAVFATSDYDKLLADPSYVPALKTIFATCSVIFLGYGVRDEYVLNLIRENAKEQNLFGHGPHFVVLPTGQVPPPCVRPIEYRIDRLTDHSSALAVIDIVLQSRRLATSRIQSEEVKPAQVRGETDTCYYISDFMPPGTWSTSQRVVAERQDELESIEATVGLGFTNDEVPFLASTAFHDLVVGLLCFDRVYLPLSCLHQIIPSLGDSLVRQLLESSALRFIHRHDELAALFVKDDWFGRLECITLLGPGPGLPLPLPELIRRYLNPVPGQERSAEALFELIEGSTTIYSATGLHVPSLTRDALLMPEIPKLLGISSAMQLDRLPRWLLYSYLRLGHLVYTAVICGDLGIQAAKLPFGGQGLTTAAFNVNIGKTRAEEAASYVVTGRYNTDLGLFIVQNPQTIERILRFRETSPGEALRVEIRDALLADKTAEFSASVNAGLSTMIPNHILETARAHLGTSTLLTESSAMTSTPAVWTNELQSDAVTRLWRDKSRQILLDLCRSRGISNDGLCPCESGEKLRDCCLPPLRT